MTDTTTKKPRRGRTAVPDVTIQPGTSVVDALAETPNGSPRFLLVSPADLTVDEDTNIRKDLHLSDNAEFVQSVRELGVLQPVVAYPDPMFDGKYRVEFGHRRAIAAQIVGTDAVPTFIVPSPADADRVAGQLAENIHRAQMSEAEQVAAFKQLALFGMPAAEIAKKTARPRTIVDAALNVAASDTAVELLEARPEITLVQAAQLLEFEDDPQTYAALVEEVAERPDQIDHVVQAARSERELEAGRQARRAELEAEGVHVFTDDESHGGWVDPWHVRVDGNYVTGAELREKLLPEHAGDLGADVKRYWTRPVDQERTIGVEWYVRTAAVEHLDGWTLERAAAGKGPKTDEEKEQARKDRTDKQLWLDATTVRRAFIQDLVRKPNPPKSWYLIVAQYLAGAIEGLDEFGRQDLVEDWLDIPNGGTSSFRTIDGKSVFYRSAEIWLEQHPNKAAHFALATALAGFEKHLEKIDAYRKPWRAEKPNVGPYLAWLAGQGYVPAQIELDIIDADIKRTRPAKTSKDAA